MPRHVNARSAIFARVVLKTFIDIDFAGYPTISIFTWTIEVIIWGYITTVSMDAGVGVAGSSIGLHVYLAVQANIRFHAETVESYFTVWSIVLITASSVCTRPVHARGGVPRIVVVAILARVTNWTDA